MITWVNKATNEEELVLLLKSRDRRGFEILYDRYSAALYGVIVKVLQSDEQAPDVLQESFVKIWKNIDAYDPKKGKLFTWILNIARNTAIDKTRSRSFQSNYQTQSIETSDPEGARSEQMPIEHIGLTDIVNSLKTELREVVDIIYFRGYTHAEAAESLNLPLGTVKTRIKIAIRELRKLIGK